MTKINTILLVALIFVSCTTNKSVIQTTKQVSKPNTPVTRTVSKPEVKASVENNSNAKPDQNFNQNTVILEATTRVKVTNQMVLAYIENYKGVAQANMEKYGIPASIILGQAILESGSGTGPLSAQANNHFGIKCHKDWLGQTVKHNDDAVDECFRKYYNASESFRDHALFLTKRPRYSSLFKLNKTDYRAWSKGLKAAGYATDPKYPTKLIALIERYQLYKYDIGGKGKIEDPEIKNLEISLGKEQYVVVKGDTLYSISKRYNIPIEELKKQNKLSDNAISIGQSILIEK
ncbi:MAG TPA: glucosaminidase domain-containing protein [Flavobacterium sp.]|nr:glucosaminidase domain-containing protein [Flavobacterium sp.]